MTTPTPAEAARELGHWLDPQGRLMQWPTRRKHQRAAAFYLIAKFEHGRRYNESSVTEVLDLWAPFRDAALLRRTLVEEGLIARTPDGREYWTTSGE
ncbi:MAG: DUF2087 domain-containing protein [Dehalococcoidia bacterium]|nr:DUF2087 domain-containing protein [Dehalococcoidia bacterium]